MKVMDRDFRRFLGVVHCSAVKIKQEKLGEGRTRLQTTVLLYENPKEGLSVFA